MAEIKKTEGLDEECQYQGLSGGFEAAEAIECAEPWEKWETQLVGYSIGIGLLALVIGGVLVNVYLL